MVGIWVKIRYEVRKLLSKSGKAEVLKEETFKIRFDLIERSFLYGRKRLIPVSLRQSNPVPFRQIDTACLCYQFFRVPVLS